MTLAILDARDKEYVVVAAGTDLIATYVGQAAAAAADAEAAAAAALAAAGVGEYPDTATGLAGTAVGETFWVDQGDGTGFVYRHDAGPVATALRPFIIDPTGSGAAGLIGATGGSVQDALDALGTSADLPSVGSFGALTPAATAATTLSAAFATVGAGGILASLEETDLGIAPVNNPGVEIVGEKGIYFAPGTGGRQLINRPGRDELTWGHENLVRWLEGLRAGATLKVALVGDSNTEGYAGAVIQTYLDSLPNVSVTNFGASGKNIEQWRTGTDVFASNGKALSNVIAYDPDLIVMCWGTNDPLFSRDANDFATSLNAALTTIRASLDINTCSVALLTPNAMSSMNGQDELYSLQLRPIIRAAAEIFTCGFFDKNGYFPNSVVDLAAGAMQNKFWDSARVHTETLGRNFIASKVAEWLAPRELWARTWDNIPQKATADLSSTYPPGLSIARMTDGAINGFVVTFVGISAGTTIYAMQFNYGFGGADARFASRVALSGVWSAWATHGPDPLAVVGSLAANYSLAGGAASLNTQRSGNMINLGGRLTISPAAQVVTGTALCTIATTSHRPAYNIQNIEIVALNAGGTVERLRGDLLTTGAIFVRGTSTMTDATSVTINETYRGA